ncbi:MAG TPA: hypothetical protein VHI54_04255 [Actinomycetota bacterium]|nr:hypothetical protein [Actinomycetota bacterium]
MKRICGVAILTIVFITLATPAQATWVSRNCFADNHADSYYKRSEARSYASVADNEGYEWGGGCWNNNNVDDTPGAPDSSGEGPDCSGLVFKSWELRNSVGASGFTWWNKLQNIHGPYSSYDYYSPASSDPFHRISKARSATAIMDAFARQGHVGMLYSTRNPSSNTDWIIEAASDRSGTDVNERAYRYDSAYVAVKREGWTPECYPNCA